MSIISTKKFLEFTSGTDQKIFIDGVDKSKIYSDIGFFKPKSADVIKRFQINIAVPIQSESGEASIDVPLIDEMEANAIRELKDEYCILHFSAILFSITRLFSSSKPVIGKMFIFDSRGTQLCTTIKDGFTFNLGKVSRSHYLHCPDYMVSVTDPRLQDSLKLRFEFEGVHLEAGSEAFYIDIGVMYRLLNNPDDSMVQERVKASRFQELQACHKIPNIGDQITLDSLKCYNNFELEDLGEKEVISRRRNSVGKLQKKTSRMRRYHARPIPDHIKFGQLKVDKNLDTFLRSHSSRFDPRESPKISAKLVKEWFERNNVCQASSSRADSRAIEGVLVDKHRGSTERTPLGSCSRCSFDPAGGSEKESDSGSLPEELVREHSSGGGLRQGALFAHGHHTTSNSSCPVRSSGKLCDHAQSEGERRGN